MTVWQHITREPALITSAVRACLYAAILFGLQFSLDQTAGILLAFEAILALITRSVVTPSIEVVATQRPDQAVPVAGPALSGVRDGEAVHIYPILGKA